MRCFAIPIVTVMMTFWVISPVSAGGNETPRPVGCQDRRVIVDLEKIYVRLKTLERKIDVLNGTATAIVGEKRAGFPDEGG